MDLIQTTWDTYEEAWERRDLRVDDYILMKGITKNELVTTTDSTVNGLKQSLPLGECFLFFCLATQAAGYAVPTATAPQHGLRHCVASVARMKHRKHSPSGRLWTQNLDL